MVVQVIFKLYLELQTRCAAARSLVQYATEMRRQWHEAQQVLAEQLLALVRIARGVDRPGGQPQCAVFQLGKFQDVQVFGDGKQFVDSSVSAWPASPLPARCRAARPGSL